ncbi:hypothetical protein RJ641_011498 [Dillenia turbinata]|uniref:Knr4/Smi1-like domain-containing protein n=1 Tax=Dillenia turbinata TaxID=194707 RepID=A0AAN8V1K5_9MAGN
MAPSATETETVIPPSKPRVCFSFAAYSKNVIDHLKSSNILVDQGLSDSEFSHLESSLNFIFPPDLRSILREGLPISPGFPNWRSSSLQQLNILVSLPLLGIGKEVSRRNFWCESWGSLPANPDDALQIAKRFLKNVPLLVPIFRNFYIPCFPNRAGNPVFYVNGGDIRVSNFDVTRFFQQSDFLPAKVSVTNSAESTFSCEAPVWAASEARRIDFWSEVMDGEGFRVARGITRGWWSGCEIGYFLDGVFWRLRDGGWGEEEVKEMMMMDGPDDAKSKRGEKGLACLVRLLSLTLLDGGWSSDEVIDSLGVDDHTGFLLDDEYEEPPTDFQRCS